MSAVENTQWKYDSSGLIIKNISKTFIGTKALDNVSAHFPSGTITGLVGRNGCGKSTLIKILSGFHDPDSGTGEILVGGQPLSLPISPHTSHAAGFRFLHQDLGLVLEMTVADNFAYANGFPARLLGRIPSRQHNEQVAEALKRFEIHILPTRKVADLPPTERTMVAIARAFFKNGPSTNSCPVILALDEPTAALPASEIKRVFKALYQVRDEGGTVIFVSHRIDEVMQICDRLVVLRDGHLIADRQLEGLKAADVVNLIVGQCVERTYSPRMRTPGEVVVNVEALSGPRLRNFDLSVRSGEILGITGLLGCGRSELIRMICGAQHPTSGAIKVESKQVKFSQPRDAKAAGIGYVPQDRRTHGCLPEHRVRENISLSNLNAFFRLGLMRKRIERADTMYIASKIGIVPLDPERIVARLSGGNQQKVVLAKWIRLKLKALVLDEPTQGVDIGAKHEIGQLIRNLADEGIAVIIGSSDFEELVPLCNRVLVLDRGSLIADVPSESLSEEKLTMLSTQCH